MTDVIKEFLDNEFSESPVESRYYGFLSVDELYKEIDFTKEAIDA